MEAQWLVDRERNAAESEGGWVRFPAREGWVAREKERAMEAWAPLNLTRDELSLPLTFPTGQYTGVVASHLISLKHLQNGDVSYCLHSHSHSPDAKTALLDFLNATVSLADLWKAFSASDARFAELAHHLGGARVLRQDLS